MRKINVTVKRSGNIEKSYLVPYSPKMMVLDALFFIQENIEPDLAFRWNCGEGICGSCAAEVNRKPVLMCKMEITPDMQTLYIEPMKAFPLIKDLVTDPSEVYEKLSRLKPYFTGPKKKTFSEIHEDEVKEIQEMRKCIDCFICYDSCHVIRNHPELKFSGPVNVVKVVALDRHPQEKSERSQLLEKEGLWNCNLSRCCTLNCPQKIKVSEDAITWAKERAVSLRNKK
ncbi:MAG: 2Fe-2S iron-sulfur cluster-binding protein [Nanoarchaeota archaeon]